MCKLRPKLISPKNRLQINKLAKGEKTLFCDRCPRKRITGATVEGTRTAAVCHFAIQHYELRGVLEKDPKITPEFLKDMYWVRPGSDPTTF
jgi:molybdenum cofactor biosynthesis enzyme MoaA